MTRPQGLTASPISLALRLELWPERAPLSGNPLLVVHLDGDRAIVAPNRPSLVQRYSAQQTMDAQFFGEQFERSVEQVVVDLALEAIAKPLAEEMKDLYTQAIVEGWWRP